MFECLHSFIVCDCLGVSVASCYLIALMCQNVGAHEQTHMHALTPYFRHLLHGNGTFSMQLKHFDIHTHTRARARMAHTHTHTLTH